MDRKIEKKKWPPKKIALYIGSFSIILLLIFQIFFSDKSSRLNVNQESPSGLHS